MTNGRRLARGVLLAAAMASVVACATSGGARPGHASKRPWGPAFTTQENRDLLQVLLVASAQGAAEGKPYWADSVFVGPALWARLSKGDPSLKEKGTRSMTVDPVTMRSNEMRVFSKEAIGDFLDSPATRQILDAFAHGVIRAATEEEREVYYAMIPFEIDTEPLTVSQYETGVLLVHFSDKRGVWVEVVSDWRRK